MRTANKSANETRASHRAIRNWVLATELWQRDGVVRTRCAWSLLRCQSRYVRLCAARFECFSIRGGGSTISAMEAVGECCQIDRHYALIRSLYGRAFLCRNGLDWKSAE